MGFPSLCCCDGCCKGVEEVLGFRKVERREEMKGKWRMRWKSNEDWDEEEIR